RPSNSCNTPNPPPGGPRTHTHRRGWLTPPRAPRRCRTHARTRCPRASGERGAPKLLGRVSLRDLLMGEFAQPITDVMRKHPIAVHALDPSEVVTRIISKYNLLGVPVLEQGD